MPPQQRRPDQDEQHARRDQQESDLHAIAVSHTPSISSRSSAGPGLVRARAHFSSLHPPPRSVKTADLACAEGGFEI
jgi:hypothetical protein